MKKPEEEHYLFLYYVQEKAEATIEQAVKYARAHNLKIVEITDRPIKGGRLQQYTDVEVIYNWELKNGWGTSAMQMPCLQIHSIAVVLVFCLRKNFSLAFVWEIKLRMY